MKSSKNTYCNFFFTIAQLFRIVVAQPYPSIAPQKGSETDSSWAKRHGVTSWRPTGCICHSYLRHSVSEIFPCPWPNLKSVVGRVKEGKSTASRFELSNSQRTQTKERFLHLCMLTVLVPARCDCKQTCQPALRMGKYREVILCLFWVPMMNTLHFSRNNKRRHNTNAGPEDFLFFFFFTGTWTQQKSLTCVCVRVLNPPPSWSVSDLSLLCVSGWQQRPVDLMRSLHRHHEQSQKPSKTQPSCSASVSAASLS